MPPPEVRHLLAAARQGNQDALNTLLTTLYPTVRALVHSSLAGSLRRKKTWVTTMFSTGDIVQDVFCRIVRETPDFDGTHERSLASFLATLVKNRLIDAVRFHEAMRRDSRRMADSDVENEAGESEEPSAIAERAEQIRVLTAAIDALSAREQQLLRARMYESTTFKDLADQLGYPSEDAARKAFHKAQARLLVRLRGAGGADE